MALVLVLGFLVVISALTVAFFSSVTTVASTSRTYAAGITTNLLADTAVQMVMAQIREGTTPRSIKSRPCWTSQPGMIRVFGATQAGSQFPGNVDASALPYAYYKLYSSDQMVLTGPGALGTPDQVTNFAAEDEYKNYATGTGPDPKQRAIFTDLNAPVLVPDPTGSIVVPAGSNNKFRLSYPILDPGAQGYPINGTPGQVEGFWLNNKVGNNATSKNPPGYGGALPPADSYNPFQTGNSNPAPMPVKWLYVLKDGTVMAPYLDSATNKAKFGPQPGVLSSTGSSLVPTLANPIVGRMAFWTDDETCKLNINTASEGNPWDTPMVSSTPESVYGQYQPAANEYQRYPGHPFSVSLSPALGRFFGVTPSATSTALYSLGSGNKSKLYSIIPRVQPGGSQDATAAVGGAGSVTLDSDRLFSSIDEMIYAAPTSPGITRRQLQTSPAMPNTAIQRMKFFLTPYNRAPELNLFGQPRISIWPVGDSGSALPGDTAAQGVRTVKDREFVFCSTIGDSTAKYSWNSGGQYQFYFTRGMPTGGAVNNAGAFSPTSDSNLTRNKELLSYLQFLTGTPGNVVATTGAAANGAGPIPGFGGTANSTFNSKYPGGDRDQILTEIFDYIRSTNIVDTQSGALPYTFTYAGEHDYSGQVVPAEVTTSAGKTYRGFGRFPTVSEAAIIFAEEDANLHTMRAILVLETFCPSYGYPALKDTYAVDVVTSDTTLAPTPLKVQIPAAGGTPAAVPLFSWTSATNIVRVDPFSGWLGRAMSGYEGFSHTLFYNSGGTAATLTFGHKTLNPGSSVESAYPFCTLPIAHQATGTFSFLGGNIAIRMRAGPSTAAPVMQTFQLNFPACTLPVPVFVQKFQDRINGIGFQSGGAADQDPIIRSTNQPAFPAAPNLTTGGDVVRSIDAKVDLRLIAGSKTVPAGFFGPAGANYTNPGIYRVHSLRSSNGARHREAVAAGVLAYGAAQQDLRWDIFNAKGTGAYYDPRTADVPEGTDGVKRSDGKYGDFDTGLAKYTDGPFINKADEGNINTSSIPYFTGSGLADVGPSYFSPNRIIASAGWFGSLPTGVQAQKGYQTLLFRPDSTGRSTHPGIGSVDAKGVTVVPPDHLLLDLFTMPVVEPYPISEPFSTAGKINLNYQILPFKYIRRNTAMRGLLRSEKLEFIPVNAVHGAHSEGYTEDGTNYRCDIDEATTLSYLEKRWSAGPTSTDLALRNVQDQVFRSPSQICELDLYPKPNNSLDVTLVSSNSDDTGQSYPATTTTTTVADNKWGYPGKAGTFWDKYRLTGDNVRERPYARLYSRLTTKSNTFTVHLRVQTLQKRANDPNQDTWDEDKDLVTGEYRGSALIERYLDPSDRRFNPNDPTTTKQQDLINPNDYAGLPTSHPANNPDADLLEAAYKFRVVSTKQFGQ